MLEHGANFGVQPGAPATSPETYVRSETMRVNNKIDVKSIFVDYFANFVRVFNAEAERIVWYKNGIECPENRVVGIPVRMNADYHLKMAKKGKYKYYQISGMMADNEIITLVRIIAASLANLNKNGIVLGALQSGKTNVGLASAWLALIHYLLRGVKYFPMFITTNQNHHREAVQNNFDLFLSIHQFMLTEVVMDNDEIKRSSLANYLDYDNVVLHEVFDDEEFRTLAEYRETIQEFQFSDTEELDIDDNISNMLKPVELTVQKRVRGKTVEKIQDLCRRGESKGFSMLFIVDEPQFGCQDRYCRKNEEEVSSVLKRMFEQIQDGLGDGLNSHMFLGLSATPFAYTGLKDIFTVKQKLSRDYAGVNGYGGQPIDDEHVDDEDRRPRVWNHDVLLDALSMEDCDLFATFEESFLRSEQKKFDKAMKRIGLHEYIGKQSQYKEDFYDQFLSIFNVLAFDPDRGETIDIFTRNFFAHKAGVWRYVYEDATLQPFLQEKLRSLHGAPIAFCVRMTRKNVTADIYANELERRCGGSFNIVRFYGEYNKGLTIKQALAGEKPTTEKSRDITAAIDVDKPSIVLVTAKLRMADQCPQNVGVFFDFTGNSQDTNAIMQGLVGRACGHWKRSIVVMSDKNADGVNNYINSRGRVLHNNTPGAGGLGNGRVNRGAPRYNIDIRADYELILETKGKRFHKDPIINRIFKRMLRLTCPEEMTKPRLKDGAEIRTANKEGTRIRYRALFYNHVITEEDMRYIEENYSIICEDKLTTNIQIVRLHEVVNRRIKGRKETHAYDYVQLDDHTFMAIGKRHAYPTRLRSATESRNSRRTLTVNRDLEPQIMFMKVDGSWNLLTALGTRDSLTEESKSVKGRMIPHAMTLPLYKPVRSIITDEDGETLPCPNAYPYEFADDEEVEAIDEILAKRNKK